MGINSKDVRDFMKAARQPMPDGPAVLDGKEKWSRLTMLLEELSEHKKALADLKKASEYNNQREVEDAIVEIGDSIGDLIFVLIGTAHSYGLDIDAIWDEIARSNRSKVNEKTGFMDKDSTGKVIKPRSYTPPNLRKVIYGRSH